MNTTIFKQINSNKTNKKASDDFNCLISWNTEGPGKKGKNKLLADEGDRTLVINPLNWKRDETYAGIRLNKGVALNTGAGIGLNKDVASKTDADTRLNKKVASKPGKNKKIISWGGKSLHFYDGTGYYENIRLNLKKRIKTFFKKNY